MALRFQGFLDKIDTIKSPPKRQAAVDEFIKNVRMNSYPHIEDEQTAVLFFQDQVDHVSAIGDVSNWVKEIPFKRVNDTDLFYLVLKLEKDARLEYLIKSDRDTEPHIDPFNPFIVHNGFGPNSELAMPQYKCLKVFDEYTYGKKGNYDRLEKLIIGPGILPYEHDVYVFLPKNYNPESRAYPTIYIQDGRDYIEYAITPVLLDNLIDSHKIIPVVAVFINPPNRHLPEQPNRMTEYGMSNDYVNFMADELVSTIEDKYKTGGSPASRLVAGDSFGGLISAYAPFLRPDVFGLGYSQSGYQSFDNDCLINAYRLSELKPIRLFIDIGTYEKVVGADMLPEDETDFLAANRRFEKVLREKGYDFVYREYPEGHTWGNWRAHMADALIHFFGKRD